MESAIYHVARAGEVFGEFSAEEFRRQRSAGEIKPTDHFWSEGMSDWEKVSEWKQPMAATVKMIPAPPTPKRTSVVPSQETPKPAKKLSAWGRWKARRANR